MSKTQIVNWYATLSPRDQRVLQLGGVAVILIVLVFTFQRLHGNLDAATAQRDQQHADLEWMRSVGPVLAAAGPGPAVVTTPESLIVLIDRSAKESGLAQSLTGTQPAGGSMRVQLERADFNLLTGWISRLTSQHGVRVESATITGSDTPGIVSATVLLKAR